MLRAHTTKHTHRNTQNVFHFEIFQTIQSLDITMYPQPTIITVFPFFIPWKTLNMPHAIFVAITFSQTIISCVFFVYRFLLRVCRAPGSEPFQHVSRLWHKRNLSKLCGWLFNIIIWNVTFGNVRMRFKCYFSPKNCVWMSLWVRLLIIAKCLCKIKKTSFENCHEATNFVFFFADSFFKFDKNWIVNWMPERNMTLIIIIIIFVIFFLCVLMFMWI